MICCICFRQRLEELQKIANKHGCKTIEELQEFVDFGWSCGQCVPSVKFMLAKGRPPKNRLELEDENF